MSEYDKGYFKGVQETREVFLNKIKEAQSLEQLKKEVGK